MPKVSKEFLHEKLEEQRYLLKKSVTDMTKGDLAEAIRVAACLRVLIHDHARSKALLSQLNRNYLELEILDDEPPPQKERLPPGVRAVVVLQFPVGVELRDDGVFLNPHIAAELRRPSILGRWWYRPSLIIPSAGGFSRKEVVLGLADKEGGSHVDAEISKRYEELISYGALRMGMVGQLTSLNVSRLMVGQAGLEILQYLDQHFPAQPDVRGPPTWPEPSGPS
ncbi:MAG: hypothetical protein ACHQT6_00310 [Candidatus Acidiferrales bacterium]